MTQHEHEHQHHDPDADLCPGLHSSTRPAPALRPEETLCRFCVGRAMHHLEELAEDLVELDVTVSRQAAVRLTGTGGRAREEKPVAQVGDEVAGVVEQRLPYDSHAAEVRADATQRLVEWAAFVAGRTGITTTWPTRRGGFAFEGLPVPRHDDDERCMHGMVAGTCAVCRGLPDVDEELVHVVHSPRPPVEPHRAFWRGNTRPRPSSVAAALAVLRDRRARNWMRTDEQGPACADGIAYVRRLVRTKIDRYDRRWYAGPCGRPTTVIDLVEDADEPGRLVPVTRQATCEADLYAEPGKAIVTCDGYREPMGIGGCGALHPAVTRHHYVVQTLRTKWLPLDAILSVMPMLVGPAPQQDTIKKWRQRGRLRPVVCLIKHETDAGQAACRVCRGELFVGGQVVDLVTDSKPRPGPKRRRERKRVTA